MQKRVSECLKEHRRGNFSAIFNKAGLKPWLRVTDHTDEMYLEHQSERDIR